MGRHRERCSRSGGVRRTAGHVLQTRLIEHAPGRTWHGYHVSAVDDTKVHRSGKRVWGTCTFHEYTARCPNAPLPERHRRNQKWVRRLPPPRRGGWWTRSWHEATALIYGRRRKVRWKEIVCVWRASGHDVPVKAVIAHVEGNTKRFSLVRSAMELTGLQMMELFAAQSRQEDGFRNLKQRLGWEECRAWTKTPIERTSQAQ